MPPDRSPNTPAGGAARLLPAAPVAAYAILCLTTWTQREWRPSWDSAIYLLTARSMSRGEGYTYLGEPFFLRPPGLSWLMSRFMDDGSFSPFVMNVLVMVFAAATVGAVAAMLHRRWGMAVGVSTALLAGTSPLFVGHFNAVLSEFPFAAALFGAIALLEPDGRRESPRKVAWARAIAAGLLLAAALHFRTVAFVLLPGVLLIGLARQRPGRLVRTLVPVAVAVVLILPWIVEARGRAAASEGPSEQLLVHDYVTAMLRQDPGDPGSDSVSLEGWGRRVRSNGAILLRDLSSTCLGSDGAAALAILVLVGLAGFLRAVRGGIALTEWFALSYALLLSVYFTYRSRLALMLVPFAYLYLLVACDGFGSWVSSRLGSRRAGRAVLLLAAGALLAANLLRLPGSLPGNDMSPGQTDVRAIATWVRENTAEDAVLLCARAPIISLLSGRRAYTYRYPRRPDPIGRYGADYVILDGPAPAGLQAEARARSSRSWTLESALPGRGIEIHRIGTEAPPAPAGEPGALTARPG